MVPKLLLILILVVFSSGCIALNKDFNKWGKNYEGLEAQKIEIGEPKASVERKLGLDYQVVVLKQRNGKRIEVMKYDKWAAAYGPDYVDSSLFINLVDGVVSEWEIRKQSVAVGPRAW